MSIIVDETHFRESFLHSIEVSSISISDTESVAIDAIEAIGRTQCAKYADLVFKSQQSIAIGDSDFADSLRTPDKGLDTR